MSLLSGVSEFFGLDIGTTAVRLVELRGGGKVKALVKYASMPVDVKTALSDSKADNQKLAQSIEQLLNQAHISTRNVSCGLPSYRVFSTVVDIDRLEPKEVDATIKYQA